MKYVLHGITLASLLISHLAQADERLCVDGEKIRIGNVQFLGAIGDAYDQFGKPIRTTTWYDSISQSTMTSHLYSNVTFTTSSDASGYDRIQRVVITKPSVNLPDNIHVGMTEQLLHTILNTKTRAHHSRQESVWSGCNCYCETTVSFTMNSERKVSKITINYSG